MGYRILVQATTRAGGDLNPLMALAAGLAAAGHSLVALCDAAAVPLFAGLGIPTVLSGPEYDVGGVVKAAIAERREAAGGEGTTEQGRALIQQTVDTAVSAWAERLAPSARALVADVRPDLVLTSFFGTCVGMELRRWSGAPWVALNSTFYIGPEPPRPLERDFSARAADVFRYSIVPYLDDATLVLHATLREFDYDHRGMPTNHRYTGPLFWEAPGEVPAYLAEPGEPWVLCGVSSLRQDDLPIAATAIQVLARAHLRLLVTLGPGHTREELGALLAAGNSETGAPWVNGSGHTFVEQYVPHSAVLPRCSVFISHAGHGSVMKGLSYGVPLVLVPWGRDQFGVAARAESMGAALVLPKERLSKHALAEAVHAVLHEPRYRWAAERAAREVRDTHALEGAVELVEGCLG